MTDVQDRYRKQNEEAIKRLKQKIEELRQRYNIKDGRKNGSVRS